MYLLLLTEDVIKMQNNERIIYIFLDVDGVLNNNQVRKKYCGSDMRIICDDNLLQFINLINKIENEYLIVLTSTWRYSIDNMNVLKKALNKYNLKLSDYLDIGQSKSRGEMVIEYCQQRNILHDDIIIIDDGHIVELPDRLVKCNYDSGLTSNEVENALMLLYNK